MRGAKILQTQTKGAYVYVLFDPWDNVPDRRVRLLVHDQNESRVTMTSNKFPLLNFQESRFYDKFV